VSADIRLEIDDEVAVITLDRPERRNAFSSAMGRGLGEFYRRCDNDDDVRVIVVTGAPPAFCAGADISARADTFGPSAAGQFSAAAVDPPAWTLRKPVIAAVNGHAIGLGLTLALQCDLRVFATDATYGVVQVRRGVMPDAFAHWTLPRLAGLAAAADILLTGRTFDGREAARLGIASRAVAGSEVLPLAMEMAHDIATNVAPVSAAFTKRLLWESFSRSADEVGRLETELHHHLMGSADAREGVMAFVERRPPVWSRRVPSDLPQWPDEPPAAGTVDTERT
jgi:enoyl-CoA hydratase/carnithine racemase